MDKPKLKSLIRLFVDNNIQVKIESTDIWGVFMKYPFHQHTDLYLSEKYSIFHILNEHHVEMVSYYIRNNFVPASDNMLDYFLLMSNITNIRGLKFSVWKNMVTIPKEFESNILSNVERYYPQINMIFTAAAKNLINDEVNLLSYFIFKSDIHLSYVVGVLLGNMKTSWEMKDAIIPMEYCGVKPEMPMWYFIKRVEYNK